MYAVSEAYKEAIKKQVVTDSISGTVTLKDGSVIEITDRNLVSGSLKITHELCDDYRIGTFNLGCLRIAFFDDNALLRDFSGAEVVISYHIETEDGTETIPMGIYIADGSSVKRRRSTVRLTAYDYGILFDCSLSSSVRDMETTAENLIISACEKCGVTFGGIDSSLPNRSVLLKPSSAQIHSYRDMLGWCASLLCGYAVIDRQGRLKIISSRYKVAEDETTILEDKILTSVERMNIYSTDTRAWIAELSAYSGATPKIYKTHITRSDSQASRAIYSLDKNPLLENKSESECDEINKEWLYFIDGFMQRGVAAEIYGDPSLDAGDVLRCSEGGIDQRKNIVGLLTKQEWRYRNFHSLVCASAQLSDGFPEEENSGEEESGTEEDENEISAPLKVIPQIEKKLQRVDASQKGGVGVFVNEEKNAERFNDYSETGLSQSAGKYSHAEGNWTEASGEYSHAEGSNTKAKGSAAHTEGAGTVADRPYAHAEGYSTTASAHAAHTEGCSTNATGDYSHAEGCGTKASEEYAHSEGYDTIASASAAHSEGKETQASGWYSHAEGVNTTASGMSSHSEGSNTIAGGISSHAEGGDCTAGGMSSHAEGANSHAGGDCSHSEGSNCYANGHFSHAEGYDTRATGNYSHTSGKGTRAYGEGQTTIGMYNIDDPDTVSEIFVIGIGTSDDDRRNGFGVDRNGNVYVGGNIIIGGNVSSGGNISSSGKVGKEYLSGTGIKVSESETKDTFYVNLNPATETSLGGVKVGTGLKVLSDGTLTSADVYSSGNGIDISEGWQISLKPASGSELGGVVVGEGLEIGEDGRLNVTSGDGKGYSEGTGIKIDEGENSDVISVKIDEETIVLDDNGNLKANGVTIENAAIIQESDAKYLLHNYTYVDYIQGNKIMYGGQQNQIIIQGYIIHRSGSKAPNGVTILGESTSKTVETGGETPDIPLYSSMDFPIPHYESSANVSVSRIYHEYMYSSSGEYGYDTYKLTSVLPTGTERRSATDFTNYNGYGGFGFTFVWDKIYPPGSTVSGITFEFGYARCHRLTRRMNSDLNYNVNTGSSTYYLPFGSLAEYHAAVALTYEPATLTQVNETTTEV